MDDNDFGQDFRKLSSKYRVDADERLNLVCRSVELEITFRLKCGSNFKFSVHLCNLFLFFKIEEGKSEKKNYLKTNVLTSLGEQSVHRAPLTL